uniref:glutathione transferase n=1 Tax=Cannabis sativa TaxID=3483 RepID=A0A803NHJ3_CANSA
MAVRKVHASNNSEPAMRVMACLNEKELAFQFVSVDMKVGEHKRQPFLSLNPFGQVPAFEDGDLTLFESRAITQYIATEYANQGTELLYSDSKKKAILLVWLEIESHQFDPAAAKLTWELVLKPMLGMGTTDFAVVEENESKLANVLDVYENRLAKSKYLAGDSFTLADLHHLPHIQYLMETRSWKLFESRSHVHAWAADITARPAWSKVLIAMKTEV